MPFSFAKVPHWTVDHHQPQMEDAGKYDYKIEFVGLFVLDEDFLLGEEKTITLPHTGEEVKSKYIKSTNREISYFNPLQNTSHLVGFTSYTLYNRPGDLSG